VLTGARMKVTDDDGDGGAWLNRERKDEEERDGVVGCRVLRCSGLLKTERGARRFNGVIWGLCARHAGGVRSRDRHGWVFYFQF